VKTASYQQVTLTLVVEEGNVDAVKRELQIAIANIGEECSVFNDRIEDDECESPEDSDNYLEYEDAA
jgi:hypothetical protein